MKLEVTEEQYDTIITALSERAVKTWSNCFGKCDHRVHRYFIDEHDRCIELIAELKEQKSNSL